MSTPTNPFGLVGVDDVMEYGPVPEAIENDHGPICPQGARCVNCGGCGCGLVPRTCPEPGRCYSLTEAEADAYRDEYDDGGYDDDDDWYRDVDDDAHDCDCDESECGNG